MIDGELGGLGPINPFFHFIILKNFGPVLSFEVSCPRTRIPTMKYFYTQVFSSPS